MFNQSYGVHITPLFINSLGGGHTHIHTQTHIATDVRAQDQFQETRRAPGLKTPGMHFYYCNDAVPWLNKAKRQIFRCTVIVKNFQIHLYFVCHLPPACLPACRKTRFRYVCGSNFSKECNRRLQYEPVVPKKIYPLRPDDSLHPSLFFS